LELKKPKNWKNKKEKNKIKTNIIKEKIYIFLLAFRNFKK